MNDRQKAVPLIDPTNIACKLGVNMQNELESAKMNIFFQKSVIENLHRDLQKAQEKIRELEISRDLAKEFHKAEQEWRESAEEKLNIERQANNKLSDENDQLKLDLAKAVTAMKLQTDEWCIKPECECRLCSYLAKRGKNAKG